MRTREEAWRRVEGEIFEAKAQALGRVGERLDLLLERLREVDRRLDVLADRPSRGDALDGEATRGRVRHELDVRTRLRDEAARLVRDLIIQREAIGLRFHAPVRERYPIPPRRE
jgi:hypothetical protein